MIVVDSSAIIAILDVPLLFKGEDFVHTDVATLS